MKNFDNFCDNLDLINVNVNKVIKEEVRSYVKHSKKQHQDLKEN